MPLLSNAQSDWTPCAAEGEACRFNGEGLVRFGIDGHYAFRVVRGQVICNNAEFGDPAPDRRKVCQVSLNWRQDGRYRGWREARHGLNDGWTLCANEGDTCTLPGAARVRYGTNGRYAYRDAAQAVRCTNDVFGDPVPDVAKQCEYTLAAAGAKPPPIQAASGLPWADCANENATCGFRGPGMVRYGSKGRYAYREANDGLLCNNDSFGFDPVPGEVKRCELLRINR
ncbi:MAG: hypothetical protein HY021_06535 [Burkholderiales bacterium]|nr:hypothetical protein [Burkholderiales bacterium]